MIIAVRTVLVAVLKLLHILSKALFAFFAGKGHLEGLFEVVLLGFGVAFGAVEPLATARGADGDLGVEDVFAGDMLV